MDGLGLLPLRQGVWLPVELSVDRRWSQQQPSKEPPQRKAQLRDGASGPSKFPFLGVGLSEDDSETALSLITKTTLTVTCSHSDVGGKTSSRRVALQLPLIHGC